jgi:hypothetical protein
MITSKDNFGKDYATIKLIEDSASRRVFPFSGWQYQQHTQNKVLCILLSGVTRA